MTYRDELEAAQARADALERELSDARAKIDALEEQQTALAVHGQTALNRVGKASYLGTPKRLETERILEGEMPEKGYTELVEAIRRTYQNVGQVTLLPGSLTWSSTVGQASTVAPYASVFITVRDGKTRIRLEERLGQLAGGIYGGLGGGIGGGGMILPIAAGWINPMLVALTIPAWLGGIAYLCFKVYRKQAAKRATRFETLADDLAAIAERLIAADSAE